MVGISPKALRFARLAAEQQPSFARDPQLAVLRHAENLRTQAMLERREGAGQYVEISEEAAFFCLKVIDAFLERQNLSFNDDWDGNDLEFMRVISNDMHQQLALSSRV